MDFLEKNKDIAPLSNFKTTEKASLFFEVKSEDCVKKLPEVMRYANKNKLPVLFVGGGTNMLFAFEIFSGIVIKNSLAGWSYDANTQLLSSYTSEAIRDIAQKLETEHDQDLWHRFIGLPGSVGGAIYGNAGCFGLETENNFVSARVLDLETFEEKIFSKADCDFSYRSSLFKKTKKYFIIEARFDLSEKKEKYHSEVDNIYFREHKQPKGNTCGSFFKNPVVDRNEFCTKFPQFCEDSVKNISAGFLLEQTGLKGFRHKTAYFSELHANFLMADDNGNYADLLALIHIAQEKVQKKFGIRLEPEVQIISNKTK